MAVVIAGNTGKHVRAVYCPGSEEGTSIPQTSFFSFSPLFVRARPASRHGVLPRVPRDCGRASLHVRALERRDTERGVDARAKRPTLLHARPRRRWPNKYVSLSLHALSLHTHTHPHCPTQVGASCPAFPADGRGGGGQGKKGRRGRRRGGLALTAFACARSSTPRPSLLSHPTDHRRRAPLQVRLRQLGKRTGERERETGRVRANGSRPAPPSLPSPFSIPISSIHPSPLHPPILPCSAGSVSRRAPNSIPTSTRPRCGRRAVPRR